MGRDQESGQDADEIERLLAERGNWLMGPGSSPGSAAHVRPAGGSPGGSRLAGARTGGAGVRR